MMNSAPKNPTIFQAAYHPKAPCVVNAFSIANQVIARMKLNPQVVAVAKLMPMSRMYSGYASAEYVNGTGPSPGEYTIAKRYIPSATHAIRAVDVSGIQNEKPVNSNARDIRGNVMSLPPPSVSGITIPCSSKGAAHKRFLRPKVSMVYTAGNAKRKLMIPKPSEAKSESRSLKPAPRKMLEE
jgi:hypothetical protein